MIESRALRLFRALLVGGMAVSAETAATALVIAQPTPSPRPPVVTVNRPELLLVPGRTAEARLRVTVASGFHVQANPASRRSLLPTKLELAADAAVRPERIVYPSGVPLRLKGSSSDLSTYEGSFDIRVSLAASRRAKPGRAAIRGKLRYQACDARVCLAPSSVPVEVGVVIRDPESPVQRPRYD